MKVSFTNRVALVTGVPLVLVLAGPARNATPEKGRP